MQGGGLGGCSVKAVFRAGIVSINEPKTPGRSSLSALICLEKKKKMFLLNGVTIGIFETSVVFG